MPRPTASDRDMQLARQARLAAIVIVATMLLWLLMQMIGAQYGWAARFAFLFDFAALGGFAFALVVTYRIWRARRDNSGTM